MKHFILGTDWWSDCDDALAVRILANQHKAGRISLDGIVINACMEYSVAGMSGFLRYSGVDVPLAVDLNGTDFYGKGLYQERLARNAGRYGSNFDAEEPVRLYRRVLAAAEKRIHILEIGFPQMLAALLKSPADEFSPLGGIELVREKVEHLWMMAGRWDIPGGAREHNFCNSARASEAAEFLCRFWSSPITFLGYEVGRSVISGRSLDHGDPLYQAMVDAGYPDGRCSWDPMLVLLGICGDPGAAGYTCVIGSASVEGGTGMNHFQPDPRGKHRFVVKAMPDEYYQSRIDALINLE